jgi:hypothetical protein
MTIKIAKIYDDKNQCHDSSFDIKNLTIPNIYEDSNGNLNIFQINHRVPDVWRYSVKICNGNISVLEIIKDTNIDSKFKDRYAIDAIGSKVILLILESPHKDEYNYDPQHQNISP